MSECERFEEMISALLDSELSEEEAAEVRAHLDVCPECRAMYDAFAAVGAAMADEDVPDTLHDGIMAKVRTAEKAKKTQGVLIRLRPILAAAACLVVLVGTVFALKNTLGMRSDHKSAEDGMLFSSTTESIAAGGAAYSASGSASGAAPETAEEAPQLFESKMAVAAAPKEAPAEEPRAADSAVTATNEAASTDSVEKEDAAELWFTVRVEELTDEDLIGVVADVGDQTFYAEGERVTVWADGFDVGELKPGMVFQVWFTPDEQPDADGIRPLALISTE